MILCIDNLHYDSKHYDSQHIDTQHANLIWALSINVAKDIVVLIF